MNPGVPMSTPESVSPSEATLGRRDAEIDHLDVVDQPARQEEVARLEISMDQPARAGRRGVGDASREQKRFFDREGPRPESLLESIPSSHGMTRKGDPSLVTPWLT